jgi:hypothetical protein
MTVHVTAGEAHRMHTSAEPNPGLRLPLSAELYFAAHDDITGELHISEQSLAIGLAGAIVLDLRFAGYLEIGWSWHQHKQQWEPSPGRFTPLKAGPVGDPLMDAALTAINYLKRQRPAAVRTEAASPRGGHPAQQHDPFAQHRRTDELRTFLRQFAADNLYERVRASMIASGLLRRTQRRRLAGLVKTDAYLAAHYGYPVRPRAFAVDAVDFYQRPSARRRAVPDEQCVAFCGLVGVLGLAEFLYHPSLSNSDLAWWLNHVVEQSRHPTIPIVVSAVDAGRGDLAVAAMR